MTIDRRIFGLLPSLLVLTSVAVAQAQTYPSKPIRIIVPFAASGTGTDLVARIAAEFITGKTGQTVVVENRGGAGGNLGMDAVAKAAPDGATLGLALATNVVVNPHIYKAMPFDTLKDLLPVAPVVATSQLIVVHDAFPAMTLQELIARAKAEPGKITYASAGVGTIAHLGAHAFAQQAGLQLVHVPYRGIGLAVGDVVAGNVQMMSVSVGPILGALQGQKAACAGGRDAQAVALSAGCADHGRGGAAGVRAVELVRHVRAERHPQGYRPDGQRLDARHAEGPGRPEAA
jgi:tripartite-type tricarboxylate transporter receptor subunit TctC